MKIFLTGATGFIGSALIPELIGAGHQVLGLTRTEAGARKLAAAGAERHPGDLTDINSLRRGVEISDAVIHCAYSHDFSRPEETGRMESQAIEALGSTLAGTDRPLVITSVTGMGAKAPGEHATEDGYNSHNPRSVTEQAGRLVAGQGANVSIVRLAQVHNQNRLGFVSSLVEIAREKGVSAYIGEGSNRWSAVHLSDAVRLYRLALEKAAPGSVYHAVGEEGISLRDIVEAIGKRLNIPAKSLSSGDADSHFGWLSMFASMDMSASSALTQKLLGWKPVEPSLLEDIEQLQHSNTSC